MKKGEVKCMQKNSRIHSLDSIRGIASMIVVIFHCLISFQVFENAYYNQQFSSEILRIFTNTPLHTFWAGPESVFLFFVLSGFVLSLPFLNSDKGGPSYRNYIIKRICRIYLPYIITMLIYMLVIIALSDYRDIESLSATFNNRWDHPITLKAIIFYIFMFDYDLANVNGVIWSLVHEMRISVIFPLLIWIIKRTDWKISLPFGLFMSIAINRVLKITSAALPNGNISMIVISLGNTFYYIPFFIIGAVFAKHRFDVTSSIKKLQPLWKILLFSAAIILFNFRWVFHNVITGSYGKYYERLVGIIGDWIIAGGVVLIFAVVLSSEKADWFLNRKIFLWLGKISYSVYLMHVMPIMLCARYLGQVIPLSVAIMLAPVFTLPLAALTYRFIELPSINLGKRITGVRKEIGKGF